MFQEESRTVQVNGKAVSGDYQYDVDYEVNNGILTRLNCNVSKTITEQIDTPTGKQPVVSQHPVGYLRLESGSKQMSLPESENATAHLTAFDQITKEVKATLEPKPASKSK